MLDDQFSETEWLDARRCARELDRILDSDEPRGKTISRAAVELGVSTRQIYNFLAAYEPDRLVSALLPRNHQKRPARLDAAIESIIHDTLRELWLVPEGPSLRPVVKEIRARSQEAGHKAPTYGTIATRIPILFTPEELATKRSFNQAKVRRLKPRVGYIQAKRPLQVCQMDHTPTDIQFVEVVDDKRRFVGRAYLTILVDVFSRCILGFCLTLEKPQTMSIALCLAHAMCPKEQWMLDHDLGQFSWPMSGRPKLIHTDSGKDFRGVAFKRGCEEFGIKIKRRNRGQVHQGGVVERLLGVLNGTISSLEGTTGSSVQDRDDYPSEARACLTFKQLEKCIALAILDFNNEMNERTLDVPAKKWAENAHTIKRRNEDTYRVLTTFMPGPSEGRALTPQGVAMFRDDYYSDWLGPFVPQRDHLGKLDVRYDPRDISHIYVRHPREMNFLPVGRRNKDDTPQTLWQYERDRAAKRSRNTPSFSERVQYRREIKTTITNSKAAQKAAIRDEVRAKHSTEAPKPYHQHISPHPIEPETQIPAGPRVKKPLHSEEW